MIKPLSFLLLTFCFATQSGEKMNVLFIAADDLNCDISAYGVKEVRTPNLDRLAKLEIVEPV